MPDPFLTEFELAWNKTLDLLEAFRLPYITIGGLAVAVIGEPRATVDLDFDIRISRDDNETLSRFLSKAKELGFAFDQAQSLIDAVQRGAFCLRYAGKRVDFILISTPMEENMLRLAQKVKLFGREAFFPRPEDLILLKIIPGRTQDIADIERIVRRHKANLDTKYLLDWAKRISDEMEDGRVFQSLKQMLVQRI